MNFLTLSLIASACLGADTSRKNDDAAAQQDEKHVTKEIQKYVNFDLSKYFADYKSILVSVEDALKMSPQLLRKLESDSKEFASIAKRAIVPCKEYVHTANMYLARLLLLIKPPLVPQATFDAWKDSGFSGDKFMALAKESLHHYPDRMYCEDLKELSTGWHKNMAAFMIASREDAANHNSHFSSINFIYYGLTGLSETHRTELEKCITLQSLDGIRELARIVVTCGQYSEDVLESMTFYTSSATDGNKVALIAEGFFWEAQIARGEELQEGIFNSLLSRGIKFDVKSLLSSHDPKDIFNAYQQCISDSADNDSTKDLCKEALRRISSSSVHWRSLEDLMNKFNGTTVI